MAKRVILYTQPGWASCHSEKEFLSQKGIPFTEKNIREDATALEELQKLGYRATPVTVIEGQVVVGFDRGKLERLLGLSWSAETVHRCRQRGVPGWGQEIEIPGGVSNGALFQCPNWAGLTLRASERNGAWTVTQVKTASCAVGEEVIVLPDEVQPGDIIECHGVRQRVTYEFGAYAFKKLEGNSGAARWGPGRRTVPTGFEVKAAEELLDAEFIAKWRDRQAIDPLARAVLRAILERFIEVGDPVTVETVAALLPERDPTQVSEAVARLDDKDLILTQGGTVMVAYPFAATPTTFKVLMPDGGQRYAVCAIDALGVSPMLGRPVTIHSHCHHCGAPLELHVRPNGPVGSGEVMVWVGERGDARQKACTSLWHALNFFRSEEHLRSWWESHPGISGAAAMLGEAFRLSARIFGELLPDLDASTWWLADSTWPCPMGPGLGS